MKFLQKLEYWLSSIYARCTAFAAGNQKTSHLGSAEVRWSAEGTHTFCGKFSLHLDLMKQKRPGAGWIRWLTTLWGLETEEWRRSAPDGRVPGGTDMSAVLTWMTLTKTLAGLKRLLHPFTELYPGIKLSLPRYGIVRRRNRKICVSKPKLIPSVSHSLTGPWFGLKSLT